MAQWDDRDPRWLVEEMGKEGSNVNGWHWEEKSKLSWARTRLKELIQICEARFESQEGQAAVTGLRDVSGEAYLSRRKGNKTLAVYDLELTLDWQGHLKTDEEKIVKGTLKISEFCLGADSDDYLWEVFNNESDEKFSCLTRGVETMKPKLYDALSQFDSEIKTLQE